MAKMLSITKQKDIILNEVGNVLKPHGFELHDSFAPTFRRIHDEGVLECYFNFNADGRSAFSMMLTSIDAVENLITEVQYPNMDFTKYKQRQQYLTTIRDKSALSYLPTNSPIQNESDAVTFSNSIIQYLEDSGLKFGVKYLSISNVLQKMNELDHNGKLWKEILSGGPEYFFRGLIVSKLCKDENYEVKVKKVDNIFYDTGYGLEEWHPYYSKLKSLLQ